MTSSSLRPVRGSATEVFRLLEAWQAADDPAPLVIETSGSTGRPKRVALSRSAMRASVHATHERLGGPGQWVLNLPPGYVAGVQVLFRSLLAGTEPVVAGADDLAASLEAMTGPRRYLSLVPTQLVRALRDDRLLDGLGGLDAVLVGGGPLDRAVRAEAEAAGLRVVQSYGMSETCGGCVYDGLPLDGVAVKIDGEGQVLVAGSVLFDGYEGEPDRTAAVLRDGWLLTRDLGRLDEDGRLSVLGRVDDVAISGGVKVPTPVVEQALSRHRDLASVAVIGVPDPEWGERVVACVVSSGTPPTLAELRDLVSPRAWAPRQLVVLDGLPLLANGKVDRLALAGLVAEVPGD